MRRQSNNSIYNALISSRGRTLRLPALGLKIWVFETFKEKPGFLLNADILIEGEEGESRRKREIE